MNNCIYYFDCDFKIEYIPNKVIPSYLMVDLNDDKIVVTIKFDKNVDTDSSKYMTNEIDK